MSKPILVLKESKISDEENPDVDEGFRDDKEPVAEHAEQVEDAEHVAEDVVEHVAEHVAENPMDFIALLL